MTLDDNRRKQILQRLLRAAIPIHLSKGSWIMTKETTHEAEEFTCQLRAEHPGTIRIRINRRDGQCQVTVVTGFRDKAKKITGILKQEVERLNNQREAR
ncbi:MAG: hypothetical protein WDZ85_03335 [Candidatus Paceibacterota bacterium]